MYVKERRWEVKAGQSVSSKPPRDSQNTKNLDKLLYWTVLFLSFFFTKNMKRKEKNLVKTNKKMELKKCCNEINK
uniref:Uncharacterized protein n=1 Tax=Octopus bimaculoides TaxID=37653 RepID=A0A0L8GET1_OCTBM